MAWKIAAAAAAGLSLSASAPAIAQHHWGYSGEAAPKNWGKLDPEFAACAIGKSAIADRHRRKSSEARARRRSGSTIKKGTTEILNNGHTVQVNYQPGSALTVEGRSFELKQFHFHAPSENTFNGKHFPLEGHLVHADKNGKLAVVAVMFS